MKKILLCIFTLFLLLSCKSTEDSTTVEEYYDPKVPGGTTTKVAKTHDVSNLEITFMSNEQVNLKWYNPSLYEGLKFEVYIYRILGDGQEGSFQLPAPSDVVSGSFLYYPRLDYEASIITEYADKNEDNNIALHPNDEYTYYVFVKKDDVFSEGVAITLTIPTKDQLVSLGTASDFWKSFTSKQGSAPHSVTGDIVHDTLFVDNVDLTESGGQIAFAQNNMKAIFTDTTNNRVLIYTNQSGLECYKSFSEGTIEFDSCIAINARAPLQVYAVLGQQDFFSDYPCGHVSNTLSNDECMTSPRGVVIKNDKVFISTGNNRIVIFDSFPEYGCYNMKKYLGDNTPTDCSFDRVIGKMNTTDLTNYTLLADGDSALSCPNGLAFKDDHLYIADTCNHRVVRAQDAYNPTLFNCTNTSWKTSKCIFSSVLGQQDFFSNYTFAQDFDALNLVYDYILDTLVGDLTFLKRYFSHPTRLYFTENDKLVVVANEDFTRAGPWGDLQLYSRLLFFNDALLEGTLPACTNLTFLANGCDSTEVLGQKNWHQLSVVPSGMNYSDNNYALKNISGIETYGSYLFLVDYETSDFIVFNDYQNFTTPTIPYLRVSNPLGVWESSQNRSLPDLKGLTDIKFINNTGNLLFFDGKGSHLYQIPILQF